MDEPVLRIVGGPRDGDVINAAAVGGGRPALLIGPCRPATLTDRVEGELRWNADVEWYERGPAE